MKMFLELNSGNGSPHGEGNQMPLNSTCKKKSLNIKKHTSSQKERKI